MRINKVRRRQLADVSDDYPYLGGLVDELCYECGWDQGGFDLYVCA